MRYYPSLTVFLAALLTTIAPASLLYEWEVGAPLGTENTWIDSVGGKNFNAANGTGGSTTVSFTTDSRINLSRGYTAANANLNSGPASGLPTGTYTLEWWIHFGGTITPNEVIFESGGGANGLGLFTNANGLELATASVNTGSDALASLSLAGLNLTHYLQIVGVFDTGTDTITLQAKDADGVTVSSTETSAQALGLGAGNAMSLFAGGNGTFSNVGGNIGGSTATGTTLTATPAVFSGTIGLFRIYDTVDLTSTNTNHTALNNTLLRADDTRPNVIVIFTDDHGYADLGIQGQDPDIATLTPNIDRIGAEGVRFTNGYITAPQCVPSRAGIISGQYQQRFGVDQNARGPLPHAVETIAERLRRVGYRTGMTGKWHLEPNASDVTWMTANGYPNFAAVPVAVRNSFRPNAQGYDEFAEGYINNYWKNMERNGALGSSPLGTQQTETGHRLDIQSDFAVSFIERNANRPFLCYLSYYAPHVPLTWVPRYQDPAFFPNLPENRRIALSMIKAMDDGVGRILDKLDTLGIDDKTIIWFIGDNGAPLGFHESNQVAETDASVAWDGSLNTPLLGEKGMLAEGGIRVPFLMRWAGTITPQVFDDPVISLDVGATAVELAGLAKDASLDGENLIPHLDGTDPNPPHDCLYWRFWDQSAIRQGQWKYLVPSASTPPMLFDLTSLRGEEDNVIGEHPAIAADLAAKLETWKSGLFRPGNLGTQLNGQESPWYKHHFGVGLGSEFNTPSNNEGWTPTAITNPRIELGKWKGEANAGAFLTQDDFFVRGASVDNLLLDLRAPENGTLTLQWGRRGADSFAPSRQLTLSINGSPQTQWFSFPTSSHPEWNGETITRIRLGFTSSNGADNEISWIRVSDGDFDRDGLADDIEGTADTDGDGRPNLEDTDSDNDSLLDSTEGSSDPDNDSLPNYLDPDSDNDGQNDRIESLQGTSTLDPDDLLTTSFALVSGKPQLTASPGVSTLLYRFYHNATLLTENWTWLEDRELVADGDVVFEHTPSPGVTKDFFRIEIMEPITPIPPILAFDPFPTGGSPSEYDAGPATSQSPSSLNGFSATWGNGDAIIEGTSLTFTDFPSSGGAISITDSTNGGSGNNTRTFNTLLDDGTYYLSFLLQTNRTSGGFQANLRLQFSGADIARIGVQNGVIGLASSTGTVSGATQVNDAAPHLLVARLDLDPIDTDVLTLYLDPTPGSPEPATPFSTLNGEFTLDGFRLFNNPGSATTTILTIDELRLASTWAAAVPTSP